MAKIYLKKGNLNYQERKLIKALEGAISEKGLNLRPANNFAELQALYDANVGEVVPFVEVKNKAVGSALNNETPKTENSDNNSSGETPAAEEDKHKAFRDSIKVERNPSDTSPLDIIDPFNSEEPLVRDYVLDGGFKDPNETQQPTKTTFEEPQNFDSSFKMPDDSTDNKGGGSGGNKSGFGMGGSDKKKSDPKTEKTPPLNPSFDDMSTAKKKKSTKKMAKAIVEGVCKLAEFGSVWWVTKDITADKVAEYEINDTMDLQVLLALSETQQVTVKQWFAITVTNANDLLKISQTEKDELAESLYEVMLEKGIAPTPMQELIINAVSTIVIGLGVKAFAMQQQVAGVLGQLTAMRSEQKASEANAQRRHEESMGKTQEHTHTHTETKTTTDTDTENDGEKSNTFDNDENFRETGLAVLDNK